MRADPSQQLRLLDLQAIDIKLAQLAHQRATHPAIKQVEVLDEQLRDLGRALADSRTAAADLKREVSAAENEAATAQARLEKNKQRIESGTLSAKDALAVSDDMTALRTWIGTLEDRQLDAMERLEAHQATVEQVEQGYQKLGAERMALVATRDQALAGIDQQIAGLVAEREAIAGQIFAELLKAYDTTRSRLGGIGAARLAGGKCEGCGLALNAGDLEAAFAAPPDQVLRCEECGRILVREAAESPHCPANTRV